MADMQQIIDIHWHLGLGPNEFDLFEVPKRDAFDPWLDGAGCQPPSMREDCLRVLLPPIYYKTTNGIEDVRRINDLIHAAGERLAGRTAGTFGVIEPRHGDAAFHEIDRIADRGMAGIAWSPRAQGVYCNTLPVTKLIAHAAERDLLSVIHATPRSMNESLWRIWSLAEQCAGIPLVALGALTEWENVQAILANPKRAVNLRYDTAGVSRLQLLDELASRMGGERLLFGSGAHNAGSAAVRADDHHAFVEAGFTDALQKMILRDNAARLLKLADPGVGPGRKVQP